MNEVLIIEEQTSRLPQIDVETDHQFSDGLYIRSVLLKQDTLTVGKRHRHATLNVLLKGEALVHMSDEDEPVHMVAPCFFESGPGVKKAVYAVTDVVFMNIHKSDMKDLESLEVELIIPEDEYQAQQEVIEWHG